MNTKIARTKKWHKQQTEGTPYFIYGPCRGCVQWFKSDRVAWFCKHTEARAYLDQKYMLELAVLYTNRERKQRGYIKKLYNNWQKQIALKSKELFSEIDALQIKNISDRDLLKTAVAGIYFQEKSMENPLLKYIGNPIMKLYFLIIKFFIRW